MCTPFAVDLEDEESDSTGVPKRSRDNLVLYLPFLHWESCAAWKQRQNLVRSIQNKGNDNSHADGKLVKDYLHNASPLHDRRSLHDTYYYNLGYLEKQREEEQEEQVMASYTKAHSETGAKMIVVDQLWLWIIKRASADTGKPDEPDLVITAFPERFNGAHDPSANVFKGIVGHLQRGMQPPLRSAVDLAALTIEHCTGVYFQRQLGEDLWFLEFFASAIGSVVWFPPFFLSECSPCRSANAKTQPSKSSAIHHESW